MRIDIVSVFPEISKAPSKIPLCGAEKGLVEFHLHNLRDYSLISTGGR